MAFLEREIGSYDARQRIRILGSFRTNGSGAPTILRDGKSSSFSVARISAGLYTVTLLGEHCLPERLIHERADMSRGAVIGVGMTNAFIVDGSWNPTARTFQIVMLVTAAAGTVSVADPITGERCNFELIGSLSSAGTDLA
jgi:hypothetical protein